MGKYTNLRGKLPAFEGDKGWLERVNAARRELLERLRKRCGKLSTAVLAREFARTKKAQYQLEDKLSEKKLALEALSAALVDRLEDADETRVGLRGGLTVALTDEPYPVVESRRDVFAWIKRTKQIDLLTVHYQTLRGIVSEALVQGRALPPGVKVFLKTRAKLYGVRRERNGDDDE